jgi:hypothetical protein
LTLGGSSTSHIYTQTVHIIQRKENNTEKEKLGKCGPCPVFVNYTLAFALLLRIKHGKTSGCAVNVQVIDQLPIGLLVVLDEAK